MAIRLASAIGEQRENVDVFGGLAGIISKTGDALQAQKEEKRKEAAKKADQEQKLKDAIAASTDFTPLVNVHPNDREKDLQFKQKGYNAIMIAAADPKITRSQLEKIQRDYIKEAQDNKYVMERDWEAIQSVAGKQETHDTERFNNLLMKGHTDPTTTAEMPNDDFMAASEADRAGKMPSAETSTDKTTERQIIGVDGKPTTITSTESVDNGSRGMKATETTTSFQGVPYLDRPISERKMTNIKALENELTTLKRPNIVLASKGYFGDNHKFASYTKKTDKITPTTGEIIYEFDEKGADLDARKFASSMIGDGNFGDKSHKQYQRALEYEAMDKGTEAGLSGEKLKDFVQESVAKVAYEDFMQNARSAEADRIKNDRDVTKAPRSGGGFNINFMGNGKYQTKTGFYQVDKGKTDTETREQQFINFQERNLPTILKKTEEQYKAQGKNKPKVAAKDYWSSPKGKEELKNRFDQSYPDTNKKVTRVYPALTPKQDGSNPEVNVVDSRGRTIAFTPSFYNIDEETNKVISVYGVEVVREKGDDGTMKTVQKPTTVPYNTKNKVINNVAPELAEVYKKETGKDVDLEVDESKPSKGAAPKGETTEQRRARLKKELIK
jgi:hypothetical protein